jgi:chemotaxis protein CheD
MVHIALPYPLNTDDKREKPGYYATTGIPALIDKLCRELGCLKGELRVNIYGGAESIHSGDIFNIGRRNIEAVKQTLDTMNLKIHKSDVGGKRSRTITMEMSSGNIRVHHQPLRI